MSFLKQNQSGVCELAKLLMDDFSSYYWHLRERIFNMQSMSFFYSFATVKATVWVGLSFCFSFSMEVYCAL